jgi:hypothetical protein
MKLILALALLSPSPLLAADDWPCVQPLVQSISIEMVWHGPHLQPGADWRSDRAIATLVQTISAQETDADEGVTELKRFLQEHQQNRAGTIGRVMTGLIDENNQTRSRLIEHLRTLGDRQRGLADIVTRLDDERDKAGSAAEPELVDRLNFAQRTYFEAQRTLRYACEIPARLDQRLGVYAKTLESAK